MKMTDTNTPVQKMTSTPAEHIYDLADGPNGGTAVTKLDTGKEGTPAEDLTESAPVAFNGESEGTPTKADESRVEAIADVHEDKTEYASVKKLASSDSSAAEGTGDGLGSGPDGAEALTGVGLQDVAIQDCGGTSSTGDIEMKTLGADHLTAAQSLWTTKRDGVVKLRMKNGGPGSETPITVPTLVKRVVERIPNHIALGVKRNNTWVQWTYAEYLRDIRIAAKAFIKLGLEPFNGVGIIGFNAPEWFIAHLACIFAWGLSTGIYTTNSAEATHYVAEKCRANVIVVENNAHLQKVLQIRDRLPHLKAIVQYSGEVAVRDDNIYSWSEFMEKGRAAPEAILEARLQSLSPNQCCVLIFTSGTTGQPKGVMLSHDNLTWTATMVQQNGTAQLGMKFGDLVMVTYLPLSHIAAQMMDIFALIAYGGAAYFAQPDALKGTLVTTLREVRPHILLGVPRVWEKMQENMVQAGSSAGAIKRAIAKWAKGVGRKANLAKLEGRSPPAMYCVANSLVFKKVKGLLGLDRCIMRLSGAAPISRDTLEYFMSLDLPICEVYGMSECSGPQTVAYPNLNRLCSVGKELPGVETMLDKTAASSGPGGEVVMHGRHVFMGYLDEEEKTEECIDEQGGLHSGDIGEKDKDGFLFITGRIKEIIITAGGENIPPVLIEDQVKAAMPVVSQCMLIGDKRKFLSLLLTLKTEPDPDTMEPSDKLTAATQEWVKSLGSTATTVTQILEPGDSLVLQAIQKGIDRVNAAATSNAQKIQKWSLLPKDFSIPGGELGPTLKLRRPIVMNMYEKTINAFYEESTTAATPK